MSNTFEMNRRRLLAGALMPPLSATWAAANPQVVEVWKDPRFGFCRDRVSIPEQTGFAVRVIDAGNSAARSQLGMPIRLGSCHTACVAGYSIEGHVPVREIQRLLRAKPKTAGLAVPGMPMCSPGMDGPIYRGRKNPNSMLLAQHNGSSSVYQSYPRTIDFPCHLFSTLSTGVHHETYPSPGLACRRFPGRFCRLGG